MKKWRFVPNQNSTIVGINDAGIETFTANILLIVSGTNVSTP